jgi:hypothetical protein
MTNDDDVNRLMEDRPTLVASYAAVAARILRALKVELHRRGQHDAATDVGSLASDMEMHECAAAELVARCILEHGEHVCTRISQRIRVVN